MENLKDKYNVEILDISTRDNAGMLYGNELFINKTHTLAMKKGMARKRAFLHFIRRYVPIAYNNG